MAVSVRDVAAVAAVSVGTVSNVLNRPDKVAPPPPSACWRLSTASGSSATTRHASCGPGAAAASVSWSSTSRNPFFTDIARGAEERAAEKGMTLLVGSSQEDPDRERAYLDLFLEQRVSGVLLSPVTDSRSRLERLRSNGVPVVLVDRQSKDDDLLVGRGRRRGGRSPGRPAPDRGGARRIAYVGGPASIRQVADRLRGARQAVRRHPASVWRWCRPTRSRCSRAGRGRADPRAAAQRRPDAIFAANDLLAIGILQALMLPGGLRVPQDIALIGYDDIDFASASVVPLSSIRQPAGVIGAAPSSSSSTSRSPRTTSRSKPTASSSSPS